MADPESDRRSFRAWITRPQMLAYLARQEARASVWPHMELPRAGSETAEKGPIMKLLVPGGTVFLSKAASPIRRLRRAGSPPMYLR